MPGTDDARAKRRQSVRRRGDGEVQRGRLRVHDPFELVRWLAMSQPDPRKALSELVQNSLDAGATSVRITRVRRKRVPRLEIRDDGEGVIPELDRAEALRYVATHIGHSRKRQLSPEQRLQLMTQGQYGIGLLGFWSLGERLEIRSSLPGQQPHRLVLYRDRPDYLIEPLPERALFAGRWTEVVVDELHDEARAALTGHRTSQYLAEELRGQLLSRSVELVIEDRMARGRAQKLHRVRPPRFRGERLEELREIPVPGYPPLRLELYLVEDQDEVPPLAVYAGGTLVAESFAALANLALDRAPWTDERLSGAVDFPALTVAPGSRRGVLPDRAAHAFAAALGELRPRLLEILDRVEQQRREQLDRQLIQDLQRALRGLWSRQPSFSLLPIRTPDDAPEGESVEAATDGLEGVEAGPEEPLADPDDADLVEPLEAPALFPPGPLAEVQILPARLALSCGTARRVRARPLDAAGRLVEEPVSFLWRLLGEVAALHSDELAGPRIEVRAGDRGGTARLRVVACSADREATAEVPLEVVEDAGQRGGVHEGIPQPELVRHPGAPWRSRMLDGVWQVNVAHRDYRALADHGALKLRYLALLFGKEVVTHSRQDPRLEAPLEELVEIAAYADRNLKPRRGRRKRSDR